MKLVALVGFKGSGKDSAGSYLVENHGFVSFSFAESLKDALSSIFCWDRELLEGKTEESRIWRESVDNWWAEKLEMPDLTPRKALQMVGTDLFRQHFHHDLWIHNIERKITLLPPDSKVVICDGRFPNEINLARKFNGLVFRVQRGPDPVWIDCARYANGHTDELFQMGKHLKDIKDLQKNSREKMTTVYGVHESEWAWIGQPLDGVVQNDGSLEDLYSQMEKVCL